MEDVKYFVARETSGKVAFARATEDNLPRIGQTVRDVDHGNRRFSLPNGDWIIVKEVPPELSDFLQALNMFDSANDLVHGGSNYESLAEDLANFVRSL